MKYMYVVSCDVILHSLSRCWCCSFADTRLTSISHRSPTSFRYRRRRQSSRRRTTVAPVAPAHLPSNAPPCSATRPTTITTRVTISSRRRRQRRHRRRPQRLHRRQIKRCATTIRPLLVMMSPRQHDVAPCRTLPVHRPISAPAPVTTAVRQPQQDYQPVITH